MSPSESTRKNPASPNSTRRPVGGIGSRPGSSVGPVEVPAPTSSVATKSPFAAMFTNLELKFGHGFPELLVGFAMSVEAPDTGQQRAGNDDVRCDLLAGRVKIVGVVNRDLQRRSPRLPAEFGCHFIPPQSNVHLPFPVHSKIVFTRDGVVLPFVPSFNSVQPCKLL